MWRWDWLEAEVKGPDDSKYNLVEVFRKLDKGRAIKRCTKNRTPPKWTPPPPLCTNGSEKYLRHLSVKDKDYETEEN